MKITINFIALLLFFFAEYSITAVVPLYITDVLQQDKAFAGYFIGIFSVGALIAKFFGGYIADRFGKYAVYSCALFLTGVVTLFYGITVGVLSILAVRLTHGFVSGTVRALYQSVAAGEVLKSNIGKTIGFIGLTSILGMILAPPLSIKLISEYSFLLIFVVAVVAYVAAAFVSYFNWIPKMEHIYESFSIKNLIDKDVFPFFLLKLITSVSYGVFLSYAIIYAKGSIALNAGYVIAFYGVANLFIRPAVGYFVDRGVKPIFFIVLSYIIGFVGYMCFAFGFSFLIGAFVIGVGFGIEYTALHSCVFKKVDKRLYNKASAAMGMAFSLGLAFSGVAASLLYFYSIKNLFIFSGFLYIVPLMLSMIFSKKGAFHVPICLK